MIVFGLTNKRRDNYLENNGHKGSYVIVSQKLYDDETIIFF